MGGKSSCGKYLKDFCKICIAFTLAETLIVMGIIGVVAALTLPNLNSSTGDKEKIAKVKKIYSNLQDAYGRAVAVYGPLDEWGLGLTNSFEKIGGRVTEFMKISKTCGMDSSGCILVQNSKGLDNSTTSDNPYIGYSYLLADGTSVVFDDYVLDGMEFIAIDIDGPTKGQHKLGVDLFYFIAYKDGTVLPYGDASNCISSNGMECTSWVIQNDNMDYLKTDSSGKCKNNASIILNGTSNITCK